MSRFILILSFFFSMVSFGQTSIKGIGNSYLVEVPSFITSSAGVSPLTVSSNTVQIITGTQPHTISLPNAVSSSTMPLGRRFDIANRSTGSVVVNDYSGNLLRTLLPNDQSKFILTAPGTVSGVWDISINASDATSLSGVVPLINGGTNAALSAVSGAVIYSDAGAMAMSASGATGQALISGGFGAPTWFNPLAGSVLFSGANGELSQDSTRLFWDDTNKRFRVGTGTDSFTVAGSTKGSSLSVSTQGGSNEYDVSFHRHSASTYPDLYLIRSRGSEASPSVVQSGDTLGKLNMVGFDGTDYEYGANIEIAVDGTPGSNDMPGRIVMSVSPDGSNTPAEALRISNDKKVLLSGSLALAESVDSSLTGANQTLTSSTSVIRVTNASLTSISSITASSQKLLILINGTGSTITLVNDGAPSTADRIYTGTGIDLRLSDKASLIFVYDDNATRWQVIGGSGVGSDTVINSRQTGLSISASTTITPSVNVNTVQYVAGNSGPVTVTASPPIATTNMVVGQKLRIVGTSDTNTVTYNNSVNLVLPRGSATLGKDMSIDLQYMGTDGTNSSWVETGRNF